MIQFIIPAVPVPQPRQRHRIVRSGPKVDEKFKARLLAIKRSSAGVGIVSPLDTSWLIQVAQGTAYQFVQNYTPEKHPVNEFKRAARLAARVHHEGPPLHGPLSMSALFVMPRPKLKVWKRKSMPREWHAGKADRDNLEKALMDALKGVVWLDDKQVVSGPGDVVIAAGDEQPHVEVLIESLAGIDPPSRLLSEEELPGFMTV